VEVLVAYGTTEGQTAKIAQHIGDTLRRLGHEATVRHAAEIEAGEPMKCAGTIVGGSLHEGRYQRAVLDFIERNRDLLRSHPSAFFSVSLAAASRDPEERDEPLRIAREATARAGWTPSRIASFAGALKYTQYSWLKRMLMKRIAGKEGGATDTSRDFEYTNWQDVDRFVSDFAKDLVDARTSNNAPEERPR
jgi:menaquinone-dependent protoporphyrinogen oxidase